jgi:hypothetical protein
VSPPPRPSSPAPRPLLLARRPVSPAPRQLAPAPRPLSPAPLQLVPTPRPVPPVPPVPRQLTPAMAGRPSSPIPGRHSETSRPSLEPIAMTRMYSDRRLSSSTSQVSRHSTTDLSTKELKVTRSPIVPVQGNRERSSHRPFDHPPETLSWFGRRQSQEVKPGPVRSVSIRDFVVRSIQFPLTLYSFTIP